MTTIITKLFGEIEINQEKLLTFEDGIIGFPYMKHFLLIHNAEEEDHVISWLQSVEEPNYALPIINPLIVDEAYNPIIEGELLKTIEPYEENGMAVFTTICVTSKLEEMTSNFKAPIIINTKNRKACQLIVEDDRYQIKQPIYEMMKKKKQEVDE